MGCAHAQVLQNGSVVGREPAPVLLAGIFGDRQAGQVQVRPSYFFCMYVCFVC